VLTHGEYEEHLPVLLTTERRKEEKRVEREEKRIEWEEKRVEREEKRVERDKMRVEEKWSESTNKHTNWLKEEGSKKSKWKWAAENVWK
jgi:hypothetical protein